ncbi:MAG: GNAT family N-acetyltransferase [Defluviitaleaceae bacterium]|nr:GNAT family N-acetyltransferase [Defluviitaleaceae bacterium]
MDIEIKKLTPALAQDYAHFFDTTPHNHSGKGDKCYCVTFCKDSVYHAGGKHWYNTPVERRAHGIGRVENGEIRGYLAYCENEPIGWCNANTKSDCKEIMNFMSSVNGVPVAECVDGEKIKFVFCFAVAPKMQKKGIATRLLQQVCRDAAAEGFDFVEAQAQREFAVDGFRGMLGMYEKCGFSIYAEENDKIIVRKALK